MLVFVLVGRASHDEDEALLGLLRTLWPFAVGLGVGWLVLARRDRTTSRPATRVAAGPLVGTATAVVGLTLRAVSGQGVAVSFLVVAVVVLALLMTGWRAAWALVGRGLRRRAATDLP